MKLVAVTKLHDRWALPFLAVILLILLGFSLPSFPALAGKADRTTTAKKSTKKDGLDFPLPKLEKPAEGSPVNVELEHLVYDPATQIAVATGKVRITWGPYVLDATKVTYNRGTDEFNAEGEVRLIEPGGTVLEADVAQIQDQFRNGFARHLRLLLTNDATLTADYAVRRDGNLTASILGVTYTRCKYCVLPNGVPFWQLKSAKVEHDEALKRMYHRDVTLELAACLVLWLPYLSHPDPSAKRASGFLTPTFYHSTDHGFGHRDALFLQPGAELRSDGQAALHHDRRRSGAGAVAAPARQWRLHGRCRRHVPGRHQSAGSRQPASARLPRGPRAISASTRNGPGAGT